MTSFPAFLHCCLCKNTLVYNKKKITRRLEDMNFIFSWLKTIVYSLRSFVKYCFYHSKIKLISSHRRVISSIYFSLGTEGEAESALGSISAPLSSPVFVPPRVGGAWAHFPNSGW